MIGAVIGDITRAAYQSGAIPGSDLRSLFRMPVRYGENTVCTIAIADSVLKNVDPALVLRGWRERQSVLDRDLDPGLSTVDDGCPVDIRRRISLLMAPVAFLEADLRAARDLVQPLSEKFGLSGSELEEAGVVVDLVWQALAGYPADALARYLSDARGAALSGIPTAEAPSSWSSLSASVNCALNATDFEDAIRSAGVAPESKRLVPSLVGAIAEARFGVPRELAALAMTRVPEDFRTIIARVYLARGCIYPWEGDMNQAVASESASGLPPELRRWRD